MVRGFLEIKVEIFGSDDNINIKITHDDGVTDDPGTVVDRVPP